MLSKGPGLGLRSEARLILRVHRDWRTYVLPATLMPAGAVYWIVPNDLIPDSIP